MKTHKLNVDELNEDYLKGTRLLCITAPIKRHLFCWLLNSQYGFGFRLCSEKEIKIDKKKRDYFFSIYQSHEPSNPFIEHILYHTQYEGEYLLPEIKHMDYLWLIKGDEIENEQFEWIKQNIKTLNGVQLVAEISADQIINKGNIVF